MPVSTPAALMSDTSPARSAALLLGVGFGGLVDGILLHQIAQWHNMGSAMLPPSTLDAVHRNMRWDGFFHAVVWLCALTGVYRLLHAARQGLPLPDGKSFTGLLLVGWGMFNLVEGILDHHLLGLHHVRDLPAYMPLYDWLFLAIGGVGLVALGSAFGALGTAGDCSLTPSARRMSRKDIA